MFSLAFIISATLITLVGAIQAPRWTYIEPSIVFNPTVSFMTLIMALLGGIEAGMAANDIAHGSGALSAAARVIAGKA